MGSNVRCLRIFLLSFFVVFFITFPLKSQTGEANFNKICVACHTIGKGKLIGPDLKNISQKKDAEWLLNFIKSSQKVIKNNDAYAVALFEEYNKIPMPDVNLSDAEIQQLIVYIDEQSSIANDSSTLEVPDVVSGNIDIGRDLFIGDKQLEKGGAACISCHNVDDSKVLYGGNLAKNLSESYQLLKSPGINSVLKFLTFPAMADTYGKNELTESEISDLTAFLKYAGENGKTGSPESFNLMFFLYSLLFFIALLYFFHIFWKNKKSVSVKEHIYNRE